MSKTIFTETKILLDSYPEGKQEQMPMFAENRVHQRTSGNPYPNKVVLEAQREIRKKEEFTLLKLENDYIELGILPQLGGKIWYAKDKKNDYGFIYKNDVVKPALIGVLGSWTSGGIEFNWPFHHRASTFMPVDYFVEYLDDGVIVWLSEHDPIDRMKGMVGVSLKNDECIFETKVKLDNLRSTRRSFLWWENAAVPVHTKYSIFFPEDVNYVNFHYKRSVTSYPIANNNQFGAYNGIIYNGDTDISNHANTKDATSYFSAKSKFDYFGGYDYLKQAGVVHVASHHISPGKKMFTWAYSQLSKTWENALTDDNGQYAELMAGCYSDNQPDFAWLEPFETKTFSQKWFPIHGKGTPTCANDFGALYWNDKIEFSSVKNIDNAHVVVTDNGKTIFDGYVNLPCYENVLLCNIAKKDNINVSIFDKNQRIFSYTKQCLEPTKIPSPRKELPEFKKVKSIQELYLEGLHMEQYRSPEYSGEACYLRCLEMQRDYVPALIALCRINIDKYNYAKALEYINVAESVLTTFNTRTENGQVYYLKALALMGLKGFSTAYDYLQKSSWNEQFISSAMTHIGLLDLRNKDYYLAISNLERAYQKNTKAIICLPFMAYAYHLIGDKKAYENTLKLAFESDKLNLFAYAVKAIVEDNFKPLVSLIKTDLTQTLLDVCEVLVEAGLTEEIKKLVSGCEKYKKLNAMIYYVENAFCNCQVEVPKEEGIAFPNRAYELEALNIIAQKNPKDWYALYLLGNINYAKGHFDKALNNYLESQKVNDNYIVLRNLACLYYSHLDDKKQAMKYMEQAIKVAKNKDKQLNFEYVYLMFKYSKNPKKIIEFLIKNGYNRDDLTVELAKAYNKINMPDKALEVLNDRAFVACEGGEHYIADQYMHAYYLKGKELYLKGDYLGAIKEFKSAQVLPQKLGSGLWNAVKKVPYEYFEAMCYKKLGEEEKAMQILNSFKRFYFDYFSNMYLPTLAYYVARSYEMTGEKQKANDIINEKIKERTYNLKVVDSGNFSTTPFFISYIDNPKEARIIANSKLLWLYYTFKNEKESAEKYKKLSYKDGYSLQIEDFTL